VVRYLLIDSAVTGIGALWMDGAFWFETGERTRKGATA